MVAVCAALLLAACAREHRIVDDGCALTDEQTVAEVEGPIVHDVVLIGSGDPRWLAWSDQGGLHVIDRSGEGSRRRLGPPCEGGLAVSGDLLACSRQGNDAKADPGHVAVYEASSGQIRARAVGVGPDGRGVALATHGERLVLAWGQARAGAASIWMLDATLEGAQSGDARRISHRERRAGRPAAVWEASPNGPALVVVWPETWIGRSDVTGRLVGLRGDRLVDLEALAYDAAHPTVSLGPRGEAIVVFRDRRPARTRPSVFLRRLGRDERAHQGVHANAEGESLAVACGESLFVVAPRTHSRTERLVAVRRHDPMTLEGNGPEHQIYMAGAAFEHADARCVGADVLVAFASSSSVERLIGTVGTVRLRCERARSSP